MRSIIRKICHRAVAVIDRECVLAVDQRRKRFMLFIVVTCIHGGGVTFGGILD